MITTTTIDLKTYNFYWKNGYLILNNLFTEKEINNFYYRASLHNDKEWSNVKNPDRYDFLIAHNSSKISNFDSELSFNLKMSEKINYLRECKKTAKTFRNLLRDKRIVSVLEELYNDKFVGLSTHIIWKKAGTKNATQAWNPHQDNSYGQSKNSKLLTINLFLDDVTIDNGAIYNYPGSHKEGLLETDWGKSYSDPSKPGKYCKIPPGYTQNNIIAPKGTLYIQHGDLIHGSHGNITKNSTRGMYSATYIVKDEKFIKGNEAFRKKIKL